MQSELGLNFQALIKILELLSIVDNFSQGYLVTFICLFVF